MRISIGLRLFLSVLLAILGVVATAVVLMRENVTRGIGEYAVNIELDRLAQLAGTLEARYASAGWAFLPGTPSERRKWPGSQASLGTVPAGLPGPPGEPGAPRLPAGPDAGPESLQRRITLLDGDGRYLAGQLPGPQASVRRALTQNGKVIGYLAIRQPPRPPDPLARAFLQKLNDNLLTILLTSLALSAVAASLLAANFRKPINLLARGAEALAAGRFDMRLPAQRGDALGDLARSFNQLAARLDGAEQSRRKWVADTSHELRTPVSVLRAQLEAVQDGVRQADPAHIGAMLRQVLALGALIDQLYVLANGDIGQPGHVLVPIDLWALAIDEAQAFADRLAARRLRLEIGAGTGSATVDGDADALRQVFANLLENCARYTAAGGTVRIHACLEERHVLVVVDDSAPGVDDDDMPHLAERFFRVEQSRSRASGGAGLGLALCRRIVADHGGELAFGHSPLGGLRATVRLPRTPSQGIPAG